MLALKQAKKNYGLYFLFFYFTKSYLVSSVMVNDTKLVMLQLVSLI